MLGSPHESRVEGCHEGVMTARCEQDAAIRGADSYGSSPGLAVGVFRGSLGCAVAGWVVRSVRWLVEARRSG